MKNEKIKAILFDLDGTLLNIDENGLNNAFAQEMANGAAHLISSLKYYEEIFEKIGRPAKDCLMVGDLNDDMVAANLGCSTFLIQNSYIQLDSNIPRPTYRGTLVDLIKLLKNWKLKV